MKETFLSTTIFEVGTLYNKFHLPLGSSITFSSNLSIFTLLVVASEYISYSKVGSLVPYHSFHSRITSVLLCRLVSAYSQQTSRMQSLLPSFFFFYDSSFHQIFCFFHDIKSSKERILGVSSWIVLISFWGVLI